MPQSEQERKIAADDSAKLIWLPVDFIVINANCQSDKVVITWKTAPEKEGGHFNIERSPDGSRWTMVGNLPAAGNSMSETGYSFTDNSPLQGGYYRITKYDQGEMLQYTSVVRSYPATSDGVSPQPDQARGTEVSNLVTDSSSPAIIKMLDSNEALVRLVNMTRRRKIVVISGSTARNSSNLNLINAIVALYANQFDFTFFQGLTSIPHFNPDLDNDTPPTAVASFRQELNEADGILICTPEYAMGVPGTLKNAIDWTVSSMQFSFKPVAVITSSTMGQKGHRSLIETLRVIESDIPEESQLLISFVKAKIKGNKITDQNTLEQVKAVVSSLSNTIDKKVINVLAGYRD